MTGFRFLPSQGRACLETPTAYAAGFEAPDIKTAGR